MHVQYVKVCMALTKQNPWKKKCKAVWVDVCVGVTVTLIIIHAILLPNRAPEKREGGC